MNTASENLNKTSLHLLEQSQSLKLDSKKTSKAPSTMNMVNGSLNQKELHPLVDHLIEESIYNQSAD